MNPRGQTNRASDFSEFSIEEALTEFASAERASPEELKRDIDTVSRQPSLPALYDAVPDLMMILNGHRQIVYGNKAMEEALYLAHRSDVYGQRPGEALHCQHSNRAAGQCGTTRFCAKCGAVKAILAGLRGRKGVEECRLVNAAGDTLDLRVAATPLEVEGRTYVIFCIGDISREKRRQVFERMFLHDVSNTVAALRTVSELSRLTGAMDEEMMKFFHLGVEELNVEIQGQKDLLAAENGDLIIQCKPVSSLAALREAVNSHQGLEIAREKTIQIEAASADLELNTDRTQLLRILGHMLKNALEATPPGGSVAMSCAEQGDNVAFAVHDDQVMPEQVQLQIFQRSFSTKGQIGRGLGTYSMKLFGERYLAGKVSFTSQSPEGTVFRLVLPKSRD